MALKHIPAGIAAALLMIGPGARAQTGAVPNPPQSNSRWMVDTRNDTCAMARQVADGPITFAVMHYPGADFLRLRIVAPRLPKIARSGGQKIRLTLSPGNFSHEVYPGIFNMKSTKALQLWVPATFLGAMATATSMRLSVGSRESVAYDLPQSAAVIRAFSQCEKSALLAWGADPAGLEPGSVRPKAVGLENDWIGQVATEVMGGKSSLAAVHRLNVGLDGRVVGCAPIGATLSAADSAKFCTALKTKARYTPARDPGGKPVSGVAIHELSIITTVEAID